MSELATLQRRFWRLISAPTGVADGLAALRQSEPAAAPLCGWITARDEAFATERLDIYANMYFFRLLGILESDYPRLLQVIGPERFHNLVTDYLLACPSENPSVRHFGARLPAFLAQHPIGVERPFLPALARVEWAWNEVFDAEDQTLLRVEDLAALPVDAWPELRLGRIAASRLLALDYPVDRLIEALARGEALGEVSSEPVQLLLWRRGHQVRFRRASDEEAVFLAEAADRAEGLSFVAMCERLVPRAAEADELDPAQVAAAAGRAQRWLKAWLEEQLLRAPDPSLFRLQPAALLGPPGSMG